MISWAGWLMVLYGVAHTMLALIVEEAARYAGAWFSGGLWGADFADMSPANSAYWLTLASFGPPLVVVGLIVLWLDRHGITGYRFPKAVISYAVYLYHRFLLSYRDVQELLFERGIDVSHETVPNRAKFGPDLAEALRYRKPRLSRTWHLDEMRVLLSGVTHWL